MEDKVEIRWEKGNPKLLCKRTLYFITINLESKAFYYRKTKIKPNPTKSNKQQSNK